MKGRTQNDITVGETRAAMAAGGAREERKAGVSRRGPRAEQTKARGGVEVGAMVESCLAKLWGG